MILIKLLCRWYKLLLFSGLEIMMIILQMRPFDDALEEYEQVKNMPLFEGYIQMLLNNEKYY